MSSFQQLAPHVASKISEVVESRRQAGPDAAGVEDAFFVADPRALARQMEIWRRGLPGVTPHYAVKCNNHPEVLKRLIALGSHFDCASRHEIQTVLALGAEPAHIVYANPVKAPSELRFAHAVGVRRMTFDNAAELAKVREHAPGSELLLRIVTDDSGAVCSLSCKYGAAHSQTRPLLARAKELGLRVVGVAYHVGSGGGTGPQAHAAALADARAVFDEAAAIGFQFTVLDVGGGFECAEHEFLPVAREIRASLERLQFPAGLELMGEPGRFFAAPVLVLAVNVIGLRRAPPTATDEEEVDMVYVSDGVYGNLNSIIYDHQHPQPHLFSTAAEGDAHEKARASLWGPTCDGLDSITKTAVFPRRLEVGDWLYFPESGAYTLVGESAFNGFNTNTQLYVAE